MEISRLNPEIIKIGGPGATLPTAGARPAGAGSFAAALDKASSLKFSEHACGRMSRFGIGLSEADSGRLDAAVSKAAAKGARESLVMLDDKLFIVSVKNKTVITAMNRDSLKESVFTNIDSAVIA